jgi:hypothetical protein
MLAAALGFGLLVHGFAAENRVYAETNCAVVNPATDAEEQAFLSLINQYRTSSGIAALTMDPSLNQAAAWMAADAAASGSLSHTDSSGRTVGTRLQNCDVSFTTAGENIAAGYTTAQQVFSGWQTSSGHNANMLNAAFTRIGIARVQSSSGQVGWVWVTDFAGGGSAAPITSVTPATTSPSGGTSSTPQGSPATLPTTNTPPTTNAPGSGTPATTPASTTVPPAPFSTLLVMPSAPVSAPSVSVPPASITGAGAQPLLSPLMAPTPQPGLGDQPLMQDASWRSQPLQDAAYRTHKLGVR